MAIAETSSPKGQVKQAAMGSTQGEAAIAQAFRRARRHSALVRTLKFLLPSVAVLIALAFFAYSYIFTPAQVSVDLLGTGYKDGKLIMANPKMEGFTRDNRPYTMRAAQAIQNMSDTDRIQLEKISARLPIDNGNWADVKADSGLYDKDKNTLDITSDMLVTTTNGMKAKLKSAFVEMKNGTMSTSKPVDITMNSSHITADSMAVQDRGKVLIFDRDVKLIMMPQGHTAEGGGTDAKQ